jgi:hypothetical protein
VQIYRIALLASAVLVASGWGPRGHQSANRAAVRALPADGPIFLKQYEDWIAHTGPLPDSWRGAAEPYSKIFEDPNHGWFKEQFAFMTAIPRSRYEFVLRLYDEYLRIREKDPERAALTNVRWTGTLPYAAMENYDRMKSAMRLYRTAMTSASPESQKGRAYLAQDIAFYMGWLGHYTADGAQPLHDTIHHDGWQGPNPKQYTTDPRIHGRMESAFVELIQLTDEDLASLMEKPKALTDPFAAILDHLDGASTHVEEVYQLDKAGAFADKANEPAGRLVRTQLAKAAALLRDLTYTAWVESATAPAAAGGQSNPVNRSNPRYNPETGTAPPAPPVQRSPWQGGIAPLAQRTAPEHKPLDLQSPVRDKNFYLLSAIERTPAVRDAAKRDPVLARIAAEHLAAIDHAVEACNIDIDCNTSAFRWTDAQIEEAAHALSALYAASAPMRTLVDGPLRASGMYVRFADQAGPAFLERAWIDCIRGINHAIDVYGLGKAPRYPAIDSVTYDPKGDAYRRIVQHLVAVLQDDRSGLDLAFSASLRFALELMLMNQRDEAGRFEPMERGENAAAIRRIQSVDWSRYPYTVIVVPGSGNDRPGVRFSPNGVLRDEIAAKRYREGKAPFVLVSGGFVHPNQTEFAEAIEMKRDLMTRLGVPEDAILIDPHARHTTTNLRNAARLMYRYGIPFDRKALVTTDPTQSRGIQSPAFVTRCNTELGYMPVRVIGRMNLFDLEFLPLKDALQADPQDPLDP